MKFHTLLEHLAQRADPLFYIKNTAITQTEFLQEIAVLSQQFYNIPMQRWALCCKDSYRFMVALLALLIAKKTPVLLPNYQQRTLTQFREKFDAILSDIEGIESTPLLNSSHPEALCITLDPQQKIVFFTSGTTGIPQKIVRSLHAIENEINTLEETFGSIMPDATIYSTVSHQHIYGLLFYLFWPLLSGRRIQFPIIDHPETVDLNKRPSVLISNPSFLSRIGSDMECKGLLAVFSSGSLLNESVAQQLAQQLKMMPFEVFGSTESGGIAFRQQCLSPDWQVLPNVSISIEPTTQQLCVRSPHFDADNILLGDRIQLNPNGTFRLLGRVDRIVKIEGKKICLTDLQLKTQEHPWVKEAYALPLETHRQHIGLLIILNERGRATLVEQGKLMINKSLRSWLLQFYEPILVPKIMRYVDTFPVNAQGKMALQDMAALFGESV